MKQSFYFYHKGDLNRHDNTLQFTNEEGERRVLPIETIGELYVMSDMTLTTSMLNLLSQYGIIVHFFNYYDFYTGSYYPREKLVSGELLVKQVDHYQDHVKRMYLAHRFVEAAGNNIYRNLRYYNGRGKNVEIQMREIKNLLKASSDADSIHQLMGFEGNIHKIYYDAWPIIIDQDIEFKKRVRNPPDNVVNTLISFVNTLIYTKVLSEIYQTQLNPTISYLHEPGERRFSLSLDLAEVFKPILADRLIFSLLNRRQITEKSFTQNLNYLHLTEKASQTIISELESRLQKTITHKELGKSVSYLYLIRLECYKLIKHLLGEKEYDPFVIWW